MDKFTKKITMLVGWLLLSVTLPTYAEDPATSGATSVQTGANPPVLNPPIPPVPTNPPQNTLAPEHNPTVPTATLQTPVPPVNMTQTQSSNIAAPIPLAANPPNPPPPNALPGNLTPQSAASSATIEQLSSPFASAKTNSSEEAMARKIANKINTMQANRPRARSLIQSPPQTYVQSQQAMLKTLPPEPPPSEEDTIAFDTMMKQNVPLSPQQIVKLRQLIDVSQRAAVIPATVPPRPVSTTIMMNLAPGTTPPAIRLAQGYVTSLVFVDSTGAPWPIAGYNIGDPKTTNIQWDGKSNLLLLQAVSPYGNSDLVIRLVGMMTPLTLELVLGQRVVDYRTDIHVSGIGPNSKDLPTEMGLPESANQVLLSVLDGIAPPDSHLLSVRGGECQAWALGDRMFLRTRFTLLSPAWIGKMVSPDGMYAYEIQKSSSVLVSQYGEPLELKIEGL